MWCQIEFAFIVNLINNRRNNTIDTVLLCIVRIVPKFNRDKIAN